MPRVTYNTQQKLEAVALGRVIGSDAAGKQLGIDPRTIVKWMSKAGDVPELAGNPGQWQRLLDLAQARTEAALATGRVTAIQAATIAGIAQRNVSKPEPPPAPPTEAEQWGHDLEAALLNHHKGHAELAMIAILEWLEELDPDGPTPSVEECIAHLEGLGDLVEWRARRTAERHAEDLVTRERVRNASAWAARGFPPAECWERGAIGPPGLDPEVLAVLEEAERYLADHREPAA